MQEQKTKNENQKVERTGTWGPLSPEMITSPKGYHEEEEVRYRINPKRTLQSLIPENSKLKVVMYVQRVDFIQELFESGNVNQAEIIIGDSIVNKNRSGTEPEVWLRLAELVDCGRLSIRVPKKGVFHEKWILAENDDKFSDIFGQF